MSKDQVLGCINSSSDISEYNCSTNFNVVTLTVLREARPGITMMGSGNMLDKPFSVQFVEPNCGTMWTDQDRHLLANVST